MVSKYISPDSCNTIVTPHTTVFSSIPQFPAIIKGIPYVKGCSDIFSKGD